MPEGQVDAIHVEIEARLDKLKDGLREAESEVKKSVGIIDRVITKDRLVGIGKTLIGIKVATEGIATATNLWQAGMAAITGDARRLKDEYNDIADSILKIPLVGALIGRVAGVGLELFGFGNLKDAERDLRRATLQAARLNDELKLAQSVQVQSKLLEALKEIDLVKREEITLEARLLTIENKRRDLIEKNLVLIQKARENATKGELAFLKIRERSVRFRVDELIAVEKQQAIEKSRLRIIGLRTDLTETFQTALGAATFGSQGGGFGVDQSPTKQGQDTQVSLLTESKDLLTRLLSAVEEGALA